MATLRSCCLSLFLAFPVAAHASGQPDHGFGHEGALIVHADHADPVGHERASDVLIDSAGRYVTVGRAYKNNNSLLSMGLVTRHRADGTPDPSLGNSGFRHLEWQGGSIEFLRVRETDNGKLMVAGNVLNGFGSATSVLVCRLQSDGTFDTGYQTNGCRTLDVVHGQPGLKPGLSDFELLASGKVIILGQPIKKVGAARGLAIVRLLPNGGDDLNFGDVDSCPNPVPRCGMGHSPKALAEAVVGRGLALDGQGRILVGAHMNTGQLRLLTVLRFNVSGTFDLLFEAMNFDNLTGDPDTLHLARDIHALPGGGAIVVGELSVSSESNQVAVARFRADGTGDPLFGAAGRVTEKFDVFAEDNTSVASAVQSDGKLLVVGGSLLDSSMRCNVLRLDAKTGDRDMAFGDSGVSTPFMLNLLSPDGCYASSIVSDAGSVVVAGSNFASLDDENVFLARLERDDLFRDGFGD